jgi:ribonucleoside-diphosphate reductase alpha chain
MPILSSKEANMNLTAHAVEILERQYLLKNDRGQVVEDPEGLFRRVARAIAQAEAIFDKSSKQVRQWEEIFYQMMTNLLFIPNSPCLMNAGTNLGQLAACFVIPLEDSMEAIFQALKEAAIIHKSGGGTGFSFSSLRPKGDIVKSTAGISSGPLSFIRIFDASTEEIKQGGKRRGANMAVLSVSHPDIMEFIRAKERPGHFRNFNFSTVVPSNFMEALEKEEDWPLVNPRNNKVVRHLPATEIMNLICRMAWQSGDPGLLFMDRVNQYNPTPALGNIESTNPCGEQPLLPYESCVLGSVNLAAMVSEDGTIDWDLLRETVEKGVRFLDNVIEVNHYPITLIKERTLCTRKIGLGIMGFADMLIKKGVPYADPEAKEMAKKIMAFIQYYTKKASIKLSLERGPFPHYPDSVYAQENLSEFLNAHEAPHLDWDRLTTEIREKGIRNATTTTIAPTGTISLIAGVSSGIEPIFALAYRRKMMGKEIEYIHPIVEEMLTTLKAEDRDKILTEGKATNLDISPSLKKLLATAYEIPPKNHIEIQSAFQLFTDNAVSKTVNLPHHTTFQEVEGIYRLAYQLGCKGITVFRDRSREQVIMLGREAPETLKPRPRPRMTKGMTWKIATGCGHLYVTVNEDRYGLCELFSQMGKTGGCAASQLEAVSRLISLALRSGIAVESLLKQLQGIRCPMPSWDEGEQILSCSDAIAKAIMRHLKLTHGWRETEPTGHGGICPECSHILIPAEGCISCPFCGYSLC